MRADVEWRHTADKVVLHLTASEYRALTACLTAHAQNEIINNRVVDCRTAASLLEDIRSAIGKPV